MTQMEFRKDHTANEIATGEERLARLREQSHYSYVTSINAVHTTAGWLLAASTAADSAGFYFAMNAELSLPSLAAASAFLVALASTFWCGVLVTRVHANEAAAADSLRRIESNALKQYFERADEHAEAGSEADALLSAWTKVAILSMFVGGACLIVGKAAQIWYAASVT